jgi:hypothetical protein
MLNLTKSYYVGEVGCDWPGSDKPYPRETGYGWQLLIRDRL